MLTAGPFARLPVGAFCFTPKTISHIILYSKLDMEPFSFSSKPMEIQSGTSLVLLTMTKVVAVVAVAPGCCWSHLLLLLLLLLVSLLLQQIVLPVFRNVCNGVSAPYKHHAFPLWPPHIFLLPSSNIL